MTEYTREQLQALMDGPLINASAKPGGRAKRANAHPFPVGTGPDGETCKTCANLRQRRFYPRTYYKCRYTESGGKSTDIRLRDKACRGWEKKT